MASTVTSVRFQRPIDDGAAYHAGHWRQSKQDAWRLLLNDRDDWLLDVLGT
jgi:hypothetical protein